MTDARRRELLGLTELGRRVLEEEAAAEFNDKRPPADADAAWLQRRRELLAATSLGARHLAEEDAAAVRRGEPIKGLPSAPRESGATFSSGTFDAPPVLFADARRRGR